MRARKRFGQHFLVDQDVIARIVDAIQLKADEHLLEIGPGQGALTQALSGLTNNFSAVEIDRDLVPFLQASYPDLKLFNADVLKFDFAAELAGRATRFVGNLPYNISSPLLLKLALLQRTNSGLIVDGHFMLQREMAERMCAVPHTKAWGRLSVMMQLTFNVEHLFDVAPDSFAPPPKVWSSIIRLVPKQSPLLKNSEELQVLDRVLRLAFGGRRKRLSNSLKALALDWTLLDVDPGVRADNVSLEEYVSLAMQLYSSETSNS